MEGRFRIFAKDVEVTQHVPDGAISVSGCLLGFVNGMVERERPSGVQRVDAQQATQLVVWRMAGYERRGGNSTSVNHRVQRASGSWSQADRVECVACGLDPNLGQHGVAAAIFQRQPIRERLRERLNREMLLRVSDLIDVAVGGGDANAEPLRVRLCELRDIGGDRAIS